MFNMFSLPCLIVPMFSLPYGSRVSQGGAPSLHVDDVCRRRTSYDDVDVTPTGLHVTPTPTSHVQSQMCVALQAGCADASSKASARTQSMR